MIKQTISCSFRNDDQVLLDVLARSFSWSVYGFPSAHVDAPLFDMLVRKGKNTSGSFVSVSYLGSEKVIRLCHLPNGISGAKIERYF